MLSSGWTREWNLLQGLWLTSECIQCTSEWKSSWQLRFSTWVLPVDTLVTPCRLPWAYKSNMVFRPGCLGAGNLKGHSIRKKKKKKTCVVCVYAASNTLSWKFTCKVSKYMINVCKNVIRGHKVGIVGCLWNPQESIEYLFVDLLKYTSILSLSLANLRLGPMCTPCSGFLFCHTAQRQKASLALTWCQPRGCAPAFSDTTILFRQGAERWREVVEAYHVQNMWTRALPHHSYPFWLQRLPILMWVLRKTVLLVGGFCCWIFSFAV